MTIQSRAIGVFDSGVGGLSVLHHIRQTLPDERLIYVADSGHVPYGDKPPEYIEQRSLALTRFLVEQGADAIVIACNTATAAAAPTLRSRFDIPIVGMEPAVKPAAAATKSGVVGVLATIGTLESARFAALLERYGEEVEIVTQGCPGLVEQVERGDLAGPETRTLVERYTAPLLARGADTLILGCTHYPFLAPLIREVVGPEVILIDTGEAVARQLQRRIESELTCRSGFSPACRAEARPTEDTRFFTSGDAAQASRIMSALWGKEVTAHELPHDFL
ncbi:MAG: glutamate racemase [Gallionella sp.]|nr:glutamate racemase [Gallionella sp.]MCK9354028.1 glutamate racemase [Gallionella sp.]